MLVFIPSRMLSYVTLLVTLCFQALIFCIGLFGFRFDPCDYAIIRKICDQVLTLTDRAHAFRRNVSGIFEMLVYPKIFMIYTYTTICCR